LSAWEIVTPITGVDPRGMTVLVWIVVGAGSFSSVVDAGAGVSASTSAAGLSAHEPSEIEGITAHRVSRLAIYLA
jgi:hypothetical protein